MVFVFDFIVKGIIISTQIINRYVAEPSLCKDTIKFSRCLEALLADLQKRWNTPEIEVPTVAYPTQFCHSSPLSGSFNCETVLIIEMPVLLCLKCIFGKFQKSVIFCQKHDFLPKKIFRLKRCPLSCEFGTENRFELRALV